MAGGHIPATGWCSLPWLIRGRASKSTPTESVTAPLSIPAPEPLRRRLALPKGGGETASLRVIIPFVPEQKRLEEVARTVIQPIPAFRLQIEHLPGISSPFIVAGQDPKIIFIWKSGAASVPVSLNGDCK